DEAGVVNRNGVSPESIPDWLGLVGDTADGIPGLPGFGAKSSSLLLQEYRHIEQIPLEADAWSVTVRGAPRLAATLAEQREDALLYRDLAVLRTDVPLPHSFADLHWQGAPQDLFEDMAKRLGGIAARPAYWIS
ncbi:MAG: 5'-3' exonuclease, partial [Candidatus Azotimanducaceae bacterium]